MTSALLDDHLLRDVLADDLSRSLSTLLRRHEPATTNLYLHRLCKSVLSARGSALTGACPSNYLRRAGGHWIAGERMRDGSPDAAEALARAGR